MTPPHAAAERLRRERARIAADERKPHWFETGVDTRVLSDLRTLADFAQGLLDETPIDKEWLLSIGFVDSDFRRLDLHPFGPLGNSLSWVPWDGEPWHGEVVYGGQRWPKPLKTRGAVRSLRHALQAGGEG